MQTDLNDRITHSIEALRICQTQSMLIRGAFSCHCWVLQFRMKFGTRKQVSGVWPLTAYPFEFVRHRSVSCVESTADGGSQQAGHKNRAGSHAGIAHATSRTSLIPPASPLSILFAEIKRYRITVCASTLATGI